MKTGTGHSVNKQRSKKVICMVYVKNIHNYIIIKYVLTYYKTVVSIYHLLFTLDIQLHTSFFYLLSSLQKLCLVIAGSQSIIITWKLSYHFVKRWHNFQLLDAILKYWCFMQLELSQDGEHNILYRQNIALDKIKNADYISRPRMLVFHLTIKNVWNSMVSNINTWTSHEQFWEWSIKLLILLQLYVKVNNDHLLFFNQFLKHWCSDIIMIMCYQISMKHYDHLSFRHVYLIRCILSFI